MSEINIDDTVVYLGENEKEWTAVVVAIKWRDAGYTGTRQVVPVLTVRTVTDSGDYTLPHELDVIHVIRIAANADRIGLVHLAIGDDLTVEGQFMHSEDCATCCREIGACHVPFNAALHPVPAVGTRYECAAVMNTVEVL